MNVSLPKGAEYELRTLKKKSTKVNFDGNKFERIESADQISSTVRLAYQGKMSQASGTKPGSEEALIEKAAAMVKYGSELEVPFVGAAEVKKLDLADEAAMTSKEMIEQMEGFVSDVRSIDSRLTVSAGIRCEFTDLSHKTSTGFNGSYRKSVWTCGGSIDLMQGDDLLSLWEFKRSIRPDFNLKEMKEVLARKLEHAKTVVPFEAGAYPVIFSPGEVGYIVNPFFQSLNGQWVHRKVSPWGDKLGQELLDKGFSLVDDGSINREWTSVPFDLEGTPTRRNVLVQKGRLENLLTNRKVAAQLNRGSSGNCSDMGISPHFLSIEPGGKSLEELISSIDKGLLIDGTMGAWSGNPFAGIVSGTISMGLKIEKGKIVGRVKDCMFTINAFEHFAKHFLGCSKETEQAQVMFSAAALFPYVMLDEVVISAK